MSHDIENVIKFELHFFLLSIRLLYFKNMRAKKFLKGGENAPLIFWRLVTRNHTPPEPL